MSDPGQTGAESGSSLNVWSGRRMPPVHQGRPSNCSGSGCNGGSSPRSPAGRPPYSCPRRLSLHIRPLGICGRFVDRGLSVLLIEGSQAAVGAVRAARLEAPRMRNSLPCRFPALPLPCFAKFSALQRQRQQNHARRVGHGERVVDHLNHCRGSAKTVRQRGVAISCRHGARLHQCRRGEPAADPAAALCLSRRVAAAAQSGSGAGAAAGSGATAGAAPNPGPATQASPAAPRIRLPDRHGLAGRRTITPRGDMRRTDIEPFGFPPRHIPAWDIASLGE